MSQDAPKRRSFLPFWFLALATVALIGFIGYKTIRDKSSGKREASKLMNQLKADIDSHFSYRIQGDSEIDLAGFLVRFDRVLEVNEVREEDGKQKIGKYVITTECKPLGPRHEGLFAQVNDYFRGACQSRRTETCKEGRAPVITSRYWPDIDNAAKIVVKRYPDFANKSEGQDRQLVAANLCIEPRPKKANAPRKKPPIKLEILMAYEVSGVLSYERSWHELSLEPPKSK